jgi:hypothetical protein
MADGRSSYDSSSYCWCRMQLAAGVLRAGEAVVWVGQSFLLFTFPHFTLLPYCVLFILLFFTCVVSEFIRFSVPPGIVFKLFTAFIIYLEVQTPVPETNNSQDASHRIPGPRFLQILNSPLLISNPPALSSSLPGNLTTANMLENVTHFSTPTLAHLIALLSHPTPTFPAQNTSIIIIDSFSTLISNAFPRTVDNTSTPKKPGGMSKYLLHPN